MRLRVGITAVLAAAGLLYSGSAQARRDKGPKLVDVKHVKTIKPAAGFIDDPFIIDAAGKRVIYIETDSGNLVRLHIAKLSTGADIVSFDINKFAKIPKRIEQLKGGKKLFLVWQAETNGPLYGGVVGAKGRLLRKFGPAKDVRLARFKGKPVVVLYTAGRNKKARRGEEFHHTVAVHDLRSGRQLKKRTLLVDASNTSKRMEFRLKYWANDYLYAVGIKGGELDSKISIRNPDVEGWYHMPSGKFHHRYPVRDLVAHKRKLMIKRKYQNQNQFMDVSENRAKLRFWRGNKHRVVKLAEKFSHYDYKSLRYQVRKGRVFFSLKIDPTNDDAVARKKADPEYLDLYEYVPGQARARRRGRLLLPGRREHWWTASRRHWIVVPRHIGFDRGGKAMKIYRLK